MENTAETQDPDYVTIAEFARITRYSPDTIRRRISKGDLREIDWVDFLGDGKLRATRESVNRFLEKCHRKMKKVLEAPLRARRAS